jgi:hypothetical protein
MRTGMGLAGLLLALVLARLVAAQAPAESILTGVNPSEVQFDKEYYKRMSKAFDKSLVIQPPTIQKTFNPASYFLPHVPKITLPSWVPLLGSKARPHPTPVVNQPQRRLSGRVVGQ